MLLELFYQRVHLSIKNIHILKYCRVLPQLSRLETIKITQEKYKVRKCHIKSFIIEKKKKSLLLRDNLIDTKVDITIDAEANIKVCAPV